MTEILSEYKGLIGVLIGAIIVTIIPWIRDTIRERSLRADRAYYLAVRVTLVLDEFVGACLGIGVHEGEEPGWKYLGDISLPDAPNLSDDVDWKSIDGKLMHEILSLPQKIARADERIPFQIYILRGEWNTYDTIQNGILGYSKLALEALDITKQLRDRHIRGRHGIPEEENNRQIASRQRGMFEAVIKQIEEQRARRIDEAQKKEREAYDRTPDNKEEKDEGEG